MIATMITSGYCRGMRQLQLSGKHLGQFVVLDDEDYDYLKQWKWFLSNSGYAKRAASTGRRNPLTGLYHYRTLYLHRLIMKPVVGQEVDHVDGDRLNNCKANLRLASRSQNNCNRQSNNKYGYKGVSFDDRGRRKYHTHLTVNGVHKSFGYYFTPEEAAAKYNEVARQHFGEYARLNHVR